jgi:hypothetical protein
VRAHAGPPPPVPFVERPPSHVACIRQDKAVAANSGASISFCGDLAMVARGCKSADVTGNPLGCSSQPHTTHRPPSAGGGDAKGAEGASSGPAKKPEMPWPFTQSQSYAAAGNQEEAHYT